MRKRVIRGLCVVALIVLSGMAKADSVFLTTTAGMSNTLSFLGGPSNYTFTASILGAIISLDNQNPAAPAHQDAVGNFLLTANFFKSGSNLTLVSGTLDVIGEDPVTSNPAPILSSTDIQSFEYIGAREFSFRFIQSGSTEFADPAFAIGGGSTVTGHVAYEGDIGDLGNPVLSGSSTATFDLHGSVKADAAVTPLPGVFAGGIGLMGVFVFRAGRRRYLMN